MMIIYTEKKLRSRLTSRLPTSCAVALTAAIPTVLHDLWGRKVFPSVTGDRAITLVEHRFSFLKFSRAADALHCIALSMKLRHQTDFFRTFVFDVDWIDAHGVRRTRAR